MLKLLKKALQTGSVTVPYPVQPVEVAPGYRGRPLYDFSRCVACGACAAACPPNAILVDWRLNEGIATWSINYGRCIFCGRCDEVCPTGAVRLSADFELAVTNKQDLTCSAEVQLARCPACGEHFAPARQVAYVAAGLEQTGLKPGGRWKELLQFCPRCRRHQAATATRRGSTGGDRGGGKAR